nr:hypothetical protein [Brucella anthropi]
MKRPEWLTKANLVRIQTMEPDDAREELARLHAEYLARAKEYRDANQERRRELAKAYYVANRATILKRVRSQSKARWAATKADPDAHEKAKARNREKWHRIGKHQPKKPESRESRRIKERSLYWRKKARDKARNDPAAMRAMIRTHVPGYLIAAAQMDVINSVMVQILDQKVPFNDLAAWVKKAVTAHNRQYDHFKNVSIDAPIAGTDGLTRADLLDSETFHF